MIQLHDLVWVVIRQYLLNNIGESRVHFDGVILSADVLQHLPFEYLQRSKSKAIAVCGATP